MKKLIKSIVESILASRARYFLKSNEIQVIGVTGSVGKTSTKEAIYTVLKSKFEVQRSQKSFNTPLGMSLAILGEKESGFSSPKAWFGILKRSRKLTQKAPEKMVLEMGADGPGDIKKLIDIAPPHISVVTAVQPVHMNEGQFASLEAIAHEKATLVRHLSSEDIAILNGDDPLVAAMETAATRITYGKSERCDLQAVNVEATSSGLNFEVFYKGESAMCQVPLIGAFQIYVCLPAIAVGLSLGMPLSLCSKSLSDFKLPPSRLNPVDGKNQTHILDGSYNASLTTVKTALEVLGALEAPRKIAALGTMNELGEQSYEAHIAVGQLAAEVAEFLITVGPEAQTLKKGAMSAGMPESGIYTFFESEKAGEFLKDQLIPGDLILVKGSQNQVRMERLVKLIMDKPSQASELLCRQEEVWEKI